MVFMFKRVKNEAKMVFVCQRVKNEPIGGIQVKTSKELSYSGFNNWKAYVIAYL